MHVYMMAVLVVGIATLIKKGRQMGTNRKKTRSPIKTKPLRQAGQSLGEKVDKLVDDKIMSWALVIILAVILAIIEWARWLASMPPRPVLVSAIAAVACGVAVWRIWKTLPQVRNFALGRQGEIVVSQALDKLKADGYRVFDDIVSDDFNVDHVLVGPGGVFAIETKTRTKRGGQYKVIYDGKNLTVNGYTDNAPIKQAKAVSDHIKDIIKPVVPDVYVQPVIIFPGWLVNKTGDSDVWVFNEKHFMKWMEDRWHRLSDDKVRLISKAIEVCVRGCAD